MRNLSSCRPPHRASHLPRNNPNPNHGSSSPPFLTSVRVSFAESSRRNSRKSILPRRPRRARTHRVQGYRRAARTRGRRSRRRTLQASRRIGQCFTSGCSTRSGAAPDHAHPLQRAVSPRAEIRHRYKVLCWLLVLVLGGSEGLLPQAAREAFRVEELLLASETRAQVFIFGQCIPFILTKARHFLVTWAVRSGSTRSPQPRRSSSAHRSTRTRRALGA